MQVDVHDVEAHVARTAFAEERVEVSTVVVHQAAGFVHHLRNLHHARLEDTKGVGVGHHHGCHLVAQFIKELAQVLDIHGAIGQALHLYDLKAADSGRGGVGAVG